jgi:hypothetical protein
MTTKLYHASVGTVTGVAFRLGPSTYFAPVDDTRLFCVEDQAALIMTGQVAPEMANFLAEVVLTPRLLALTERP